MENKSPEAEENVQKAVKKVNEKKTPPDYGTIPVQKPEGDGCKSITITADTEKLGAVLIFVDELLESVDCPIKTQMQIDVAIEELFVNIARYAYHIHKGKADISVWFDNDANTVYIEFCDKGVPFDPLAKEDPDITLSAEKRKIGGLGIYMVKKSMDGMHYRRDDDKNILTIWKKLR